MRCGAAIFSIGYMIDRCLNLIQIFEVYNNSDSVLEECRVHFVFTMISDILSLTFIFLQSFFIFKYANIIINCGKNAAVIGFMHLICTNFLVSLQTFIYETVAEIRHHKHAKSRHNQGRKYE